MDVETRNDRLRAGLLAGALAAQVAASLWPRGAGWVEIPTNLAFWGCLLAYIGRDRWPDGSAWGIAIAPLYWATFLANREGTAQPDHVFNSDTYRYLAEAAAHKIQARHIGFPVVTFVLEGWDRLGIGREILHVQTALAGGLSLAVFRRILARLAVPSVPAWASTAGLGVALSTWAFAAVIESYLFTVLFTLLLIERLAVEETGRKGGATIPALLGVAALGFSLENLILVAIAGGAILASERAWRPAATYAALTAALFGVWISAVAAARGPGFYATWGDEGYERPASTLVDNLRHFASETWDASRLASPRAHAATAARIFVVALVGRPGEPPWRYGKFLDRRALTTPPRLAAIAALLAAAAIGAPGIVAAWRLGGAARRALALAGALLVARHAFIVAFSPGEGILFAIPSLSAGWLVLAVGASHRPRWAGAALATAAIVAAIVNAIQLAGIASG